MTSIYYILPRRFVQPGFAENFLNLPFFFLVEMGRKRGIFRRDQAAFVLWRSLSATLKNSDVTLVSKLIATGAVTQAQYDQARQNVPS